MPRAVILDLRKETPGFIPMEEAFLGSALARLGWRDIEIRSVFPDEVDACADDLAAMPADTRVLLWESASYKSCQTLLDYFRLARALRERSGLFLAGGGYWAATLHKAYPEHFRPFDLLLPGFDIDRCAEAFASAARGPGQAPTVADVDGPCRWDQYELDLSRISTLDRYVGNGYVSGYRTTFGCPMNCHFCYNNMLRARGARYDERSLDKVERDVRAMVEHYGDVPVQLKDRNFFCNKERAFGIMDMLRSMGVTIASNLDVTVRDAEEDIFRKCAEAGVTNMFFGLESLHEESLKRFNKVYPLQKLDRLFDLADEYEIMLTGCLLLGLPWQTAEIVEADVLKAIDHMDRHTYLRINFNNYHPLIDTALQREYFPDVAEKISLEELHEVYNFRLEPDVQRRLYGPAFEDVNFETMRAHAMALNSISLLEHHHVPPALHPVFAPVKALLRDNVMRSSEDNAMNRFLTMERIVATRRGLTRISIEIKNLLKVWAQ